MISYPVCQFLCCKDNNNKRVFVAWKKDRNDVKADVSFSENTAATNSSSVHQEGVIIVIISSEGSCDVELQN